MGCDLNVDGIINKNGKFQCNFKIALELDATQYVVRGQNLNFLSTIK